MRHLFLNRANAYYWLNIKPKSKLGLLIALSFYFVILSSCSKFVEVDTPITNTNADLVFRTDASAIAALNNIYTKLSQQGIATGVTSLSLYASLSADDLESFNNPNDQQIAPYVTNSLTATNYGTGDYWINTYGVVIFLCNSAIERLTDNTYLTAAIKDQLLGEALFIRSLSYFYLINLYGDVPLVLGTDHAKNSNIVRTPVSEVYLQIINDLEKCDLLLSNGYLDGTLLRPSDERIVPNKWAAKALLARIYLYKSEWQKAISISTEVIEHRDEYELVSVENVFKVNNRESIWQLQSVSSYNTNTSDAVEFLTVKEAASSGRVYLANELVDNFEVGDARRNFWIDSVQIGNLLYFLPGKYKIYSPFEPVSERQVLFRLAEQYLIRSEARLHANDISGSLDDLNIIRRRANLKEFKGSSFADILRDIVQQRRLEYFTEYGHRWFDLKRLGEASLVLGPKKGAAWQSTDELYPIPLTEIQKNVGLSGRQNPGY